MTSNNVPKLDLIGHLRLDEEQPNSHAVKNVETDEEISWGTPLTTARTQRGTPKQLISSLRERTPKIETSEKNLNQKEKYFYLNESARPLHDLTSRMPPDPLKEKDTNVEDMARFVLEFKDLITAECFEKIDAENQERERVKSIVHEQMMEDALSVSPMSSGEQKVAKIPRNPGPIHNGQCRRLHDTQIAPAGSNNAKILEQSTAFRARIITKNNKDALRELHGFFFLLDEKLCIYDYRAFGKTNHNRSVTLILERNRYQYCHGRRKGENYSQRDIRPGATLSFYKNSGRFPVAKNEEKQIVYLRITDVDEYVVKAFDPWWGIPTGGARTEEEREDRQVLGKVQAKVRETLKERFLKSVSSLRQHFAKLDKSGDGLLSKSELISALERADIILDKDETESVWRIVDEDQSNSIGYEEFLAGFIGEMTESRSSLVRKAWRKMDPKGNGECNIYDAKKVLNFGLHPKVKSGVTTTDQIFSNFCKLMNVTESKIQFLNFFEFFLLISLLTDRDEVFFNLLHIVLGV